MTCLCEKSERARRATFLCTEHILCTVSPYLWQSIDQKQAMCIARKLEQKVAKLMFLRKPTESMELIYILYLFWHSYCDS